VTFKSLHFIVDGSKIQISILFAASDLDLTLNLIHRFLEVADKSATPEAQCSVNYYLHCQQCLYSIFLFVVIVNLLHCEIYYG